MSGEILKRMCSECGGRGWFTHPNTICRCAVCKGTGSCSEEEDRKHQIRKAALDLLAALKQCQEAMRLNLVKAAVKNEQVLLDAYNAADAAIRKAEG